MLSSSSSFCTKLTFPSHFPPFTSSSVAHECERVFKCEILKLSNWWCADDACWDELKLLKNCFTSPCSRIFHSFSPFSLALSTKHNFDTWSIAFSLLFKPSPSCALSNEQLLMHTRENVLLMFTMPVQNTKYYSRELAASCEGAEKAPKEKFPFICRAQLLLSLFCPFSKPEKSSCDNIEKCNSSHHVWKGSSVTRQWAVVDGIVVYNKKNLYTFR